MDFLGINYITELYRKAEVTVLLEKIHFDRHEGCSVVPVQCPAEAEGKEGLIYNAENRVVCVRSLTECPYFKSAAFDIKGYIKEIQCVAR